jgi:hypothetical protein
MTVFARVVHSAVQVVSGTPLIAFGAARRPRRSDKHSDIVEAVDKVGVHRQSPHVDFVLVRDVWTGWRMPGWILNALYQKDKSNIESASVRTLFAAET